MFFTCICICCTNTEDMCFVGCASFVCVLLVFDVVGVVESLFLRSDAVRILFINIMYLFVYLMYLMYLMYVEFVVFDVFDVVASLLLRPDADRMFCF